MGLKCTFIFNLYEMNALPVITGLANTVFLHVFQ